MEKTQNKFDKGIAITGAIIPVGIAIGNIAFEAAVVLTSLIWIARVIKFKDCDLKRLIEHPAILPSLAVYISIVASVFINGAGSKGYLIDD